MQPEYPLPYRVDIRGDFIYWYSNQSGLGFTTKSESTFTTSNFSNGSLVDPSFDWDPGVRLDVIYGFDRSYWSLGADALWYGGTGSGSKNIGTTDGMFPALSFASSTLPTDYVTNSKINWRLNFTILDFFTSYEWVCNSYFALIPSLGLRNIWITEKAHVSYQGGTFQAGTDTVRLTSRFYGVGPRLALRPQVTFGQGFSFYAEGAGEFFGGWFDIHQNETFLGATLAKVNRDVSGIRWAVDTTAGVVYAYDISNTMNVSLDVGFDYSAYFDQNEFVHGSQYTLHSQGSALTLYGIHIAAGYRF